MKPIIDEQKRETLLGIKDAVEGALTKLHMEVEYSELIPEEEYKHLEKYFQDVYDQINRFYEEVYYS